MTGWQTPPRALGLGQDEVHVWRVPLNLPVARVLALRQTLAAGELARVRCFRFQEDRDSFIVARGLLRTILGRYLAREPGSLRFCRGPHGKPYLAGASQRGGLRFNLSHSDHLALYAVARGREVGVDIECVRSGAPLEELARQSLSAQKLAAGDRLEVFFEGWTQTEAYLKARGEGLPLPLDRVGIPLAPAGDRELPEVAAYGERTGHWSLCRLDAAPGFSAALVVEGDGWQLKCWQWIEE